MLGGGGDTLKTSGAQTKSEVDQLLFADDILLAKLQRFVSESRKVRKKKKERRKTIE